MARAMGSNSAGLVIAAEPSGVWLEGARDAEGAQRLRTRGTRSGGRGLGICGSMGPAGPARP